MPTCSKLPRRGCLRKRVTCGVLEGLFGSRLNFIFLFNLMRRSLDTLPSRSRRQLPKKSSVPRARGTPLRRLELRSLCGLVIAVHAPVMRAISLLFLLLCPFFSDPDFSSFSHLEDVIFAVCDGHFPGKTKNLKKPHESCCLPTVFAGCRPRNE